MKKFAKTMKDYGWLAALLALVCFLVAGSGSDGEAGVVQQLVSSRGGSAANAFNAGVGLESVAADETFGDSECTTYEIVALPDGELHLCYIADDTILPTVTPTPTAEVTGTPTATNTPPPVGSMPLCDDHDDQVFHELISESGDCHYDHFHGSDFSDLDFIMLTDEIESPPWPWGNENITLPNQTPNENEEKHTGNIRFVGSTASDISSDDFQEFISKNIPGVNGAVVAWRIQTHTVGAERALMVRVHSNYGQVWVENSDETLGFIGAGGWGDWGKLMSPYKVNTIETMFDDEFDLAGISFPAINPNQNVPPYRAGETQEGDNVTGRYASQWNLCSNAAGAQNPPICFDFVAFEDFGGVDDAEGIQDWLGCTDGTCDNNHSLFRVYEIIVETPSELTPGADGKINYSGWTNLHGQIVDESECVTNEYGVFPCAPLEIVNMEPGRYAFRVDVGTNGRFPPNDRWMLDFDTSPPGEAWIDYPYR